MVTNTYQVKGMHCASCSSVIEKTLKKVKGVNSIEVNYGTEKAKISFDPQITDIHNLSGHIHPLGYSFDTGSASEMAMTENEHAQHLGLDQSKTQKLNELAQMRQHILVSIPLAIISAVFMSWESMAQYKILGEMPEIVATFMHHLLPIIATYVLFVVGKPYLLGFYRFLRHGKANMDSLIGIGTTAAFLYSFIVTAFENVLSPYINVDYTYYDVTIVVITFIALGKYLEARAKLKTGDAIEKLLNLQAKTAIVVKNGDEVEVPINQVVHGDSIIVKPGSSIPVDGVLSQGSSYVDESMVTGESMPVQKNPGDLVVAGTINTTGSFVFTATKIGSETLLSHIIKMVEDAQGSRAPIQALADKVSSVFVPVVLVLSFITLGAWLIFGIPIMGLSTALSYGLTSFVGILVIACPCALGLATPTAIIVGVGKGAKEGILIKDAATLEKLHGVNVIVVDKTGTITNGKPELVSIKNLSGLSEHKLISILASLENKSEHPIAHAVSIYAKSNNISVLSIQDFEIIKGKGVKAVVDNIQYYAGNTKLISDLGLPFDLTNIEPQTAQGQTPVVLATQDEVLGVVMVADAVKSQAIEAIKDLKSLNIQTIMLTGDNKNTAHAIARQVGIDQVVAEVLPEAKLIKIQELQKSGNVVAMVGDGINDAPALAQADVGVAMGTGTDVAIETAGITLLHGDVSKLVKAVRLSRITMRGIRQNLFWAFIYNIIGIPLAAGLFFPLFGWLLNPVFAGLAMAFSSVSVVANSLRLKTKKI